MKFFIIFLYKLTFFSKWPRKRNSISLLFKSPSKNLLKSHKLNRLVFLLNSTLFDKISKLLLLYSSQFGIYIMPQLNNLESTSFLKKSLAWYRFRSIWSVQRCQIQVQNWFWKLSPSGSTSMFCEWSLAPHGWLLNWNPWFGKLNRKGLELRNITSYLYCYWKH